MKKYIQITTFLAIFGGVVIFKDSRQQSLSEFEAPIVTVPPINTVETTTETIYNSQNNSIYNDGTYTGTVENAYYGYIQAQAIIQNGVITNINFLQYPNDNRTSSSINAGAIPIWRESVLKAQSGQVDIVSGASDSSLAFRRSITKALASAQK